MAVEIDRERAADGALLTLERDASTPRSRWRSYALALLILDVTALALGAVAARFAGLSVVVATGSSRGKIPVIGVLMIGAPAWLAVLALSGAYHQRWLGSGSEEYRRVTDAAVRFVFLVALVAFLLNVRISRGFVAVALVVALGVSLVQRYLLRQWLHGARRQGTMTKSVLVVGSAEATRQLLEQLRKNRHSGLRPVGACVPRQVADSLHVNGWSIPVLAEPDRVLHAALIAQADAIAVADATTLPGGNLRRLAWQLEGTGIDLMVAPAVTDVAGPRISVRPVADLPLLHVEEPELNGLRRLGKATLDRLLALVLLVVLSPLLMLICVAVKLTSRGPVMFRQVRVGLGGRHFKVWKFRTMTRDAESLRDSLTHLNEHDGLLFKIERDPRITGLGRALRRLSLDELPQLWNVLRGDMSIVGPRPPIPSEVERYDDTIRRRLLVKPGMTGLWQVSGRAGLPWDEAVRLDLYYVENWSLTMDAVILLRTMVAVFKRHGAY